jgi:hypothetical protein
MKIDSDDVLEENNNIITTAGWLIGPFNSSCS